MMLKGLKVLMACEMQGCWNAFISRLICIAMSNYKPRTCNRYTHTHTQWKMLKCNTKYKYKITRENSKGTKRNIKQPGNNFKHGNKHMPTNNYFTYKWIKSSNPKIQSIKWKSKAKKEKPRARLLFFHSGPSFVMVAVLKSSWKHFRQRKKVVKASPANFPISHLHYWVFWLLFFFLIVIWELYS